MYIQVPSYASFSSNFTQQKSIVGMTTLQVVPNTVDQIGWPYLSFMFQIQMAENKEIHEVSFWQNFRGPMQNLYKGSNLHVVYNVKVSVLRHYKSVLLWKHLPKKLLELLSILRGLGISNVPNVMECSASAYIMASTTDAYYQQFTSIGTT